MTTKEHKEIVIPALKLETRLFCLVGQTGFLCHRFSMDARKSLLIGGRNHGGKKRQTPKHNPRQEFRDSMYINPDAHPHTSVFLRSAALKSALGSAALESAGVTKAEINRLVTFPDEFAPLFGIPVLRMDVMRSANMARTPDIRTRAYFPSWATQFTIHIAGTSLSDTSLANLFYLAGMVIGIGDSRQEKGRGNFGRFALSNDAPDAALLDKEAQWDAIQVPQTHDMETAELLAYYDEEVSNDDSTE